MQRYSLFRVLRYALRRNTEWEPAWRTPTLQRSYDVVIIGGGHGLATAYYLAKKHNVRRVAVLERRHIGQGNSGRNTQVRRSNYFYPVSSSFFDHSLKLYEGMSRELNFKDAALEFVATR
jgi:glycine/D-amino acid oxidase-like deaminating enzyme